jgi:hypothetical protein
MKAVTLKSAKGESLEQKFQRFAKALMAVPKKELDRELAKHERKRNKTQSKGRRSPP